MNTRQLTALALKIFAIYIFVEFLLALPNLFVAFHHTRKYDSSGELVWLYLLGTVFLFAIILLITYYVWKLAEKLLVQMNPDNSHGGISDPEGFILSVLGLFLVVLALVSLVHSSTGMYVQATHPDNPDGISAESAAYFIGNMMQLLVGITLVIKTKGWVRVLRRLRQAGLHD